MSVDLKMPSSELEGLVLPGISTIVFTEECESTQDGAKLLARSGMPEGVLVLTRSQTGGRGRLERQWHSPRGGLYMSLLLRPLSRPDDYPALTLKAAACIARAAKDLYGMKTRVKEPNDVYACDAKGNWRKLAGILTEASTCTEAGAWLVMGIGVNLSNPLSAELREKAVAVSEITGERPDVKIFLRKFFSLFQPEYAAWQTSAASKLK